MAELTVPAVTAKVAEVWPCDTVTVEGTLASAGEALMPIVAPPLKAGEVNDTEQVAPDEGLTVVGLQVRLLSPGFCRIVTVPPVTEVAMVPPIVSAANPPANCSDEEVLAVEDERVSVSVPTTPLEITELLRPHTKQVIVPGPGLQFNVLFVSADPAAKLADEKSVVE